MKCQWARQKAISDCSSSEGRRRGHRRSPFLPSKRTAAVAAAVVAAVACSFCFFPLSFLCLRPPLLAYSTTL